MHDAAQATSGRRQGPTINLKKNKKGICFELLVFTDTYRYIYLAFVIHLCDG
jgi:hypothetical protein